MSRREEEGNGAIRGTVSIKRNQEGVETCSVLVVVVEEEEKKEEKTEEMGIDN